MLFLILFGFVVFVHSLPDTTRTAQYFCNMKNSCRKGTKSVACFYTRSAKALCDGISIPFDKYAIVKKHNDYRQAIASGQYPKYKTASAMSEIIYNDELAQMALYNVKECKINHDGCFETDNFPHSGQNLAIIYLPLGTFDASYADVYISNFIDDWFSEYKIANMNMINKLPWSTDTTGHFLQMVQDKCQHIGCELFFYEQNRKDNLLFACNYGYGNIITHPVYARGPPASKCISRSRYYSALCSA